MTCRKIPLYCLLLIAGETLLCSSLATFDGKTVLLLGDTITSRRTFGIQTVSFLGGASLSLVARPASAATATASQQDLDKDRILKGYDRLTYLLENWERETTVCGKSGDNPYITKNGCERTPIKVMEYLGYKVINDPLFKADRTMRRLEALVPPGRELDFLEAIDVWGQAADEASGMAYVSSWGEANPGGT
jgi:hypothetical protein